MWQLLAQCKYNYRQQLAHILQQASAAAHVAQDTYTLSVEAISLLTNTHKHAHTHTPLHAPYSTQMQITPMNMLSGRLTLRMCDMMSCCIEMRINCAKESLLLLLKPQQSTKLTNRCQSCLNKYGSVKIEKFLANSSLSEDPQTARAICLCQPQSKLFAAAYQNFCPMKQAREGSTSKFNVACVNASHLAELPEHY